MKFLIFVLFFICNSKNFRCIMGLPLTVVKFNLWLLHVKLLTIGIHEIKLLHRCCSQGHKTTMLLMGTHQFFNSPSPVPRFGLLMQASDGVTTQVLYNFVIFQVCLQNMVDAATLFTMFDQHQLKKKTVLQCKAAFRKMVLGRGYNMISLGIHCHVKEPSH